MRTATSCGLTVLVSDVSLAEFGEAALLANLEDLDWLDEVAREHHYVHRRRGAAVPAAAGARLATVYGGDAAVLRLRSLRGAPNCTTRCTGSAGASKWGVQGIRGGSGRPGRGTRRLGEIRRREGWRRRRTRRRAWT